MTERPELLFDGPPDNPEVVVLAHGAGAPMDSPFMETVAHGLSTRGVRVVRFEFDYMRRRRSGGRRPPDGAAALQRRWKQVVGSLGEPERLVIGGKSLGGRIASMIADDLGVRGLVCLGYPFHPPRRPNRLRVAHLKELRTPTLIVQGTRDALGNRDEVEGYDLAPTIRLAFIEDGDHSFKPPVRSGRNEAQNLEQAIETVAEFVQRL